MTKIIKSILFTAAFLLLSNPSFAQSSEVSEAIELAKAKAINELNISDTDIRYVRAEASEWHDSSLGCPQKGMQYQPVMTPGHVIKLMTNTDTYTLHVGAGHAVFCDQVSGTLRERSSVRDQSVINLVQLARDDLNKRVENSEKLIRVTGITPTKWPDASLGCPMPDMAYAQAETAGYVIEFEHGDVSSTYHTDMNRVIRCDQ